MNFSFFITAIMLEELPRELILKILEYLNMKDLYLVTTASEYINDTAKKNRNIIAKEILVRLGIMRGNINTSSAYDVLELMLFYKENQDDIFEPHVVYSSTDINEYYLSLI